MKEKTSYNAHICIPMVNSFSVVPQTQVLCCFEYSYSKHTRIITHIHHKHTHEKTTVTYPHVQHITTDSMKRREIRVHIHVGG